MASNYVLSVVAEGLCVPCADKLLAKDSGLEAGYGYSRRKGRERCKNCGRVMVAGTCDATVARRIHTQSDEEFAEEVRTSALQSGERVVEEMEAALLGK